MRDEQWLMLGPISFVNSSCRSNVEYRQKGGLVVCIATKKISTDDELTVFYNRRYFGKFNINCLCPYKSEHSDPCPNDPEPVRKRNKISEQLITTPSFSSLESAILETPIRRIVLEKLHPRRALYKISSSSNVGQESYLSYNCFFF